MKKIISNSLFAIYIVIAIFVTICLLSYNQFKVTEFGNNSLVIISDNGLEPDFNKGDLVIVNKKDLIKTGEKVFFYNTYDNEIDVKLGVLDAIEPVTPTENTYVFEGDRKISGEYVLGTAETAEVIPTVGSILGVLESKWGFLFLIVLPALIAFIYQITVVYSDIKSLKEENKEQNKDNNKNNDEK